MSATSSPAEIAASARTWLFVPGDRFRLFDKAAASGADVVVVDLEDAVEPDQKLAAREHLREWATKTAASWAVRVNAAGTPWHDEDLAATGELGPALVMLPKAEDPAQIARDARALAEGSTIIALVESARGILDAAEIAVTAAVSRLALGSFDLAAQLGVDPDHAPALAGARQALVLASAAGELAGPVDGVTGAFDDPDSLIADIAAAKALGFAGKLCVHPDQVRPAAAALCPTADEITWAERVLAAAGDSATALVVVDGQMIDAPVIARARHIRAASAREEKPSRSTETLR